jgi:hypothetical protein
MRNGHDGHATCAQSRTSWGEPPEQSRHLALMASIGLIALWPTAPSSAGVICRGSRASGRLLTISKPGGMLAALVMRTPTFVACRLYFIGCSAEGGPNVRQPGEVIVGVSRCD